MARSVRSIVDTQRYLRHTPAPHLTRPVVRLKPILAKPGTPSVDLAALAKQVAGVAVLDELVAVESPEHWGTVVRGLGSETDAILPLSIPCYPTEVWNSHPQPLVDRRLPLVFWPLIAYDEPDFWRWSARDFLQSLGVEVHLVQSSREGLALLRALGMRRMLRNSSMVVFGKQNFPWNAPVAGHHVSDSVGTRIVVRTLAEIRDRASAVTDTATAQLWEERCGRYRKMGVGEAGLTTALRTTLAIRAILEEEHAMAFGVNCFGELVTEGGRDVPCLAQCLLREEGYIASCDGDYLAMMSMALTSYFLDKPCMMSNMYPVRYTGALTDHFGDPLKPNAKKYPRSQWTKLARLGHCGFVGVVSPEMTPSGTVSLQDWGGTYEIKRDGNGCGIDGDLAAGTPATMAQLKFDGRTFVVAEGDICETTRHTGMPHCESTALVRFSGLEPFVDDISREHSVFVYGRHAHDYRVLSQVLGLECRVY